MNHYRLRGDVPINLPAEHKEEALHLRNKLLLFRFRNLHRRRASEDLVDRAIEPRLNQIFVPLLSIIEDPKARADLRELARRYNREIVADRGMDTEAQILEVIRDMLASPFETRLSVKDITSWFVDRHGMDYERKVTGKWVGNILRRKLQLKTERRGGEYVIPESERSKLLGLYERYGLNPQQADEPDTVEELS